MAVASCKSHGIGLVSCMPVVHAYGVTVSGAYVVVSFPDHLSPHGYQVAKNGLGTRLPI